MICSFQWSGSGFCTSLIFGPLGQKRSSIQLRFRREGNEWGKARKDGGMGDLSSRVKSGKPMRTFKKLNTPTC